MKENFATIETLKFSNRQFDEFITKAQDGSLMENQLKIIMDEMLSTGKNPEEIIKEKGFDTPAMDNDEIELLAKEILE
jgi:Asp-tRNA(Asn)/Glu-tRNA(Gln) amidotransferase B subunit